MNLSTSIFLIVCALLLGISIGGYVATLRQAKKTAEPEKETQDNDLIHLRKDPASGVLEVVIAGKTFRSADEMSSVQRTLAGYAFDDLRSWLSPQAVSDQTGVGPTAVKKAPEAEPSTTEAVSEPPSSPPVETPSMLPYSSDQQSEITKENAEAEEPEKRKRGGLIGVITRAFSADVSSTRIATVSIAVQVNTILQKKLVGTPLESRGICLMELPGQEMVVMIGPDRYDNVNAVPDDEIRGVIQSAVNEWLARSTT